MILRRKIITVCALLFCILTVCLATMTNEMAIPTQISAKEEQYIIIDAGHGGLTNTTH